MRLSISNLSFPIEDRARSYAYIKAAGADGVELAPTRLGPWNVLSEAAGRLERELLSAHGLQASSLQAIFYGRPELQLLGDEAAFGQMLDHTRRLGDYADAIGAEAAVFGAPAHRNRGTLSIESATALAQTRLHRLGEALEGSRLKLCIEPIPAAYKGDFLQTYGETIAMVRAIAHPNIRLHLDTGCVLLAGDDIAEAVRQGSDLLQHFQAAEPQLGGFANPAARHLPASIALADASYSGWVAIEMLEQEPNALLEVERAISYAKSVYDRDEGSDLRSE